MRDQQRAPKAIFERYYAKEYSHARAWKAENGGFTRTGLLSIEPNQTEKIGKTWSSNESEVASTYYDTAEKDSNVFWSPDSIFYNYFRQLDCSSLVELACGHGRHVPHYIPYAKKITLVDINNENIVFCKSRYGAAKNIEYIVNTGCDFTGISTDSQSAIFSYDAMVHFELTDVLGYLKDANRILITGGKILFHHSNIDFYPELSGLQKPLWRNFMSADIFAHLATRAGFKVLAQHILTFGRGKNFYPNTDCISLCEKSWTL